VRRPNAHVGPETEGQMGIGLAIQPYFLRVQTLQAERT
jgi:hypothetical protein